MSTMYLSFNLKIEKFMQMFSNHRINTAFSSIVVINEALPGYLAQVTLIWRCGIELDLAPVLMVQNITPPFQV